MVAAWHEGERVRVRGETWTIGAVRSHADCLELHLRGADRDNAGLPLALLCPFDRPCKVEGVLTRRFVHPRRWLHEIRRLACEVIQFGTLADVAWTGLTVLPYQLEPALAFLRRGTSRVLIADGVGLGKTIQAGILVSALHARHPSLRVLVVTPAGLRDQWAGELRDRFGLAATITGASWLRRSALDLPRGVVPWSLPGMFICSYDFLKRPEVLRSVEDLGWDLVIADEAHNASPATARRAALDAVSRRAQRVLLLTATPHGGDAGEFEALCAIGRTSHGADDLVIFRRTAAEVGRGVARRSVMLTVQPTPGERAMHQALARYIAALRVARCTSGQVRLAAIVLQKRALSSAASLAESARRRLDLLAGRDEPRQIALPLGEEEPLDDETSDEVLATPGLADSGRERQLLERVIRAAGAANAESKPAFLLRLLRRIREPVILFTEYRDTLRRLARTLESHGYAVTLLHGGLSLDERALAQQQFNRAGGVLLATDAAAEGLNLHQRCRVVIHYELPWSPARLEQRAGRVDRIGQTARVHELLLVAGHPAERLVLVPLARRATQVRTAGGGIARALDVLTERAVADAILDRAPLPGCEEPVRPLQHSIDLAAEAADEARRLEDRRRWRARSVPRRGRDRGPAVFVTRRRHHPGTVTCVYRLSLLTAAGRVVHEELIAANDEPPPLVVSQILARTEALYHLVGKAVARRACEIRADMPSTARALVQAGLFDRRALRERDAQRRASEAIVEAFAPERSAADASEELVRSRSLVAVLVG